jgi:hypothetical protein
MGESIETIEREFAASRARSLDRHNRPPRSFWKSWPFFLILYGVVAAIVLLLEASGLIHIT